MLCPVASPASGHVPPLAFERIFFARLYVETSCLVWLVYTMPYSNSALNSAVFALEWRHSRVKWCVCKSFYRATPCVSAVFAVGRCPSVHPSVRHVRVLYCIQTAEDIIKHLSWPGSTIILVFDTQALIPNSRRTPSSGVQNTQGRLRSWTEIAVYLGNGRR